MSEIIKTLVTLQKKRLAVIFVSIALLLMVPFIAMQFTDQVNWTLFDFAIMGGILFAVAMAYEIVARRSGKTKYRVAFGIGLAGLFLLFWVNGAVGIIGNEGQTANLLYGTVFVVALVGALLARFKPRGMAHVLMVTAFVQMFVPLIALIIWPPPDTSWSPGVFGVFMLNTFFACLFILSAFLFRRADQEHWNRGTPI